MAEKRGRKPKSRRRERITFGQARTKLQLDTTTKERIEKAGLVERWVNDENDGQRLKELYDRGYEFYNATGDEIIGEPDGGYTGPDEGSHMRKFVGMGRDNKPMYAYLMVQDKRNYEEDQMAKAKINDQVDDAIKSGNSPGPNQESQPDPTQGSTYVKDVKYQP